VPEIVTIGAIGHRGDGMAQGTDGPIYVPFTLPGERVLIERNGERGRLIDLVQPSPERVQPPRRHFGRCGGCALQMMPLDAARRLKRAFVVGALAQQGLTPDVAETVGVDPSSRRRAVLTAVRVGKRMMVGYHERLSNRIVDIEECPVLAPPLAARLPGIRAVIEPLAQRGRPVRVIALLTRAGIDLALESAVPASPGAMPALASLAQSGGIARISFDGEPILSLAEPAIEVSGVKIVPPPGAFVQASAEAEAAMTELVVDHLAGATRVADLFAGVGTFSLALARTASIRAVESSASALDALAAAARRAAGLKRIETERRDLFAFPLAPAELAAFDGVAFDPPRAGAKAQALALAASRVQRVAAISCNPASFARDARTLVDGGYALERVAPVDQFVYSAETEVVGLFARRRK
jgi:23S rRNA (uracil1939-C5)-methyltransferase